MQLPVATTQFNDNFTEADYVALVGKMLDGTVTVSNDTTVEPAANATTATVNSYGNIK